jgi:hypothetical protein
MDAVYKECMEAIADIPGASVGGSTQVDSSSL